ncbi:hypothetical protein [Pseudoruegeria sp. HB172150]|uniref:hypothetical protein n=1 Tax=Pseudoruegeria sp. HB172150 TaxID=2721164 RepID=UPI00155190E2|nr:hypothetical protein [Pseudoruegeria sp. HB172150]
MTKISFTRRALLAFFPTLNSSIAFLAFARTPAMAVSDPHSEWLAEWRDTRMRYNDAIGLTGHPTPESDKIWSRLTFLENELKRTPARTIKGAAAQIGYILEESAGEFTYAGHEEALASALNALGGT